MTPRTTIASSNRLSHFIQEQIEPILCDWEAFARTLAPGESLSARDLRDHAKDLLLTIALDMQTAETEAQRDTKSKGHDAPIDKSKDTAAYERGATRQLHGFDLSELAAEFRALRASVLRLWKERPIEASAEAMEDIARFNEGIDQALTESIASYSAKIAESRETFMAVLGHDLRGPLAAMNNCLQLLGKPETPPRSRERVFQIGTRSIAHMDSLITDLLAYTQTRLGRGLEVSARPGDFNALCQEAVEEARTAHPEHRFVCEGFGGLSAAFDSARMKQVLGNLLNNAVQHGDSDVPITMNVGADGGSVKVVITNQGMPIPDHALQTIFDPLVQLPKPQSTTRATRDRQSSMGLGLFIARQIVTAHGGSIDVTSSAAQGTAFTVLLPKTAETA